MGSIETVQVTKYIRRTMALDSINLKLSSGKIYGVVGKNGSGKTMLLRLLAGLIKPTTGKLYRNGVDVTTSNRIDSKIGIVIENAPLYSGISGQRNLTYLAEINKHIGIEGVRSAMKKVGLDPDDGRIVRKYSLGMKQRLAIAQAIMEEPDFLFLDEPTNALDRDGVLLTQDVVLHQAKRGAVVVLTSHNTREIETLCDVLYYMENGKIHMKEERNTHETDE
jgi:ABC-2 type transport system ATP-binding protein